VPRSSVAAFVAGLVAVVTLPACADAAARPDATGVSFAVHGGTGGLRRGERTPEQENALRDGLSAAVGAGRKVILLVSKGADDFAAAHGLEIVNPSYFWTQKRWADLQRAKQSAAAKGGSPGGHVTVGAVCRDGSGNVAAATSTGGLTNKTVDRVGDSPIVGAGVFADNRTVAVSATGTGEVFIRGSAASTISDMIEFGGVPMAEAARRVVVDRVLPLGGTGGVIALSPSGELAVPHTTPGLIYGSLTAPAKSRHESLTTGTQKTGESRRAYFAQHPIEPSAVLSSAISLQSIAVTAAVAVAEVLVVRLLRCAAVRVRVVGVVFGGAGAGAGRRDVVGRRDRAVHHLHLVTDVQEVEEGQRVGDAEVHAAGGGPLR
jgi:isoaspartyl peptidase/L-asparaginase-like protein (Ntn-hydrolase superfamily)